MARRPRHLSAEDKALWKKVADSTERLHPARPRAPALPAKPAKPTTPPSPSAPTRKSFRLGEKTVQKARTHDFAPNLSDSVARQPLSMDRKTFGKMKKGRMSPEGRLDLHGMTIAQAHPRLTRFILDAAAQDRRLVLVITGKGKHRDDGGPIPVRHGVLRHQVPHWLRSMPLSQYVMQVEQAHLKHGGHGAYYVYLRRRK
ncbi:Smr/MutS family protein [uncultured Aliiroseovarius sp.]|uniref:Smr/MutS family protein n=1 Tax=uncultured Aliiroseovarius sp. TaxID=1658783 RepID=UPI00259878B4|nr:Smr/MutS family protein [uncultured Aliiroseovarius sp.]